MVHFSTCVHICIYHHCTFGNIILQKTVNRVKVMLKDLWTHVMPSGADDGSESTQFENDEETLYAHIKGEYTELIVRN